MKDFSECDSSELEKSLFIIDSVKDFFLGDMTRDNFVDSFMETLKIITAKGGTVVMLHHQTKQFGEENNRAWKGSTLFNDSADDTYYMSSSKKNSHMIINLEVIKSRSGIKDQTFIMYENNHEIRKLDKTSVELLSEKERYTIEIAREIINERVKIKQGDLAKAIKIKAEEAGVLIVGDNKKWKLFDRFKGKFWNIQNCNSGIKKIFTPILSKNFQKAKQNKKKYIEKLKNIGFPISVSKFGNMIYPRLKAAEVLILFGDEIIVEDEYIVDIRE